VGQSELENEPSEIAGRVAVFGSLAFSTAAAPLTPQDAAGHIGETATVCDVVASAKYEANAKSQPTLLDLGKAYPNAVFTAVVLPIRRPPRAMGSTSSAR
jgi:hypothetical protein